MSKYITLKAKDLKGSYELTIDPERIDCSVCPCGYKNECGMWCGSGHQTGMCPPRIGRKTNKPKGK